jgi:hypothetical protein
MRWGLRERNVRYGALGVCIGSGQGVALVLENPEALQSASSGVHGGPSGLGRGSDRRRGAVG